MSNEPQRSNNFTAVSNYGYNESYFNGTGSNITSTLPGASPTELFGMPVWFQRSFDVIFTITVLVATFLNPSVIYIILRYKKMRENPTNYFILNLAVADLLTSIFNTPFNYYFNMYYDWKFGETYCKINQFLSNAFVAVSVLTLLVTSYDRHRVICKPLGTTLSMRKTAVIIVCIWAVCLASSAFNWIYYVLYSYLKDNATRYICMWDQDFPYIENIYNKFFLSFTIICIGLMGRFYYDICKLLWYTKDIGEPTDAQRRKQKERKRTVKMLICVVVSVVVCWSLYQVYFVVKDRWPSVNQPFIYIFAYWLAMLHSAVNPILYFIFLPNFRRHFKQIVRCQSRQERPQAVENNQQNGLSNDTTMATFVSFSQKHSLDALTDKAVDETDA